MRGHLVRLRRAVALLVAVTFTNAGRADTIAVTEFLVAPMQVAASEWVELFNYGADPVDLTGWTISDETGQSALLPSIVLPSGGYMVLTGDLVNFLADWFLTVPQPFAFQFSSTFVLSNINDEMIIRNDMGDVVWNVAYPNDDTTGLATWLTTNDFSITNYGTRASPGVVRNGDDLGMAGFLGYQQNNFTPDPFAWTTGISNIGSPLAGGYAVIPGPGGAILFGLLALHRRRGRRMRQRNWTANARNAH